MKRRFECEYNWIIDNKRNSEESLIVYDEECDTLDDLCDLLNRQADQIVELEEQLKNSIRPKFNVGQEVWFVHKDSDIWEDIYKVLHKKVMAISYNNYEGNYFEYAMSNDGTRDTIWYGYIEEKFVFATEEEAIKKLEGLKGE